MGSCASTKVGPEEMNLLYKSGREISRGAFGEVHEGKSKPLALTHGKPAKIAIKICKIGRISEEKAQETERVRQYSCIHLCAH